MAQHWSVHKAGRLGSTYATLSHADDLSQELTNQASFYIQLWLQDTRPQDIDLKVKSRWKLNLNWSGRLYFFVHWVQWNLKRKHYKSIIKEIVENHVIATLWFRGVYRWCETSDGSCWWTLNRIPHTGNYNYIYLLYCIMYIIYQSSWELYNGYRSILPETVFHECEPFDESLEPNLM